MKRQMNYNFTSNSDTDNRNSNYNGDVSYNFPTPTVPSLPSVQQQQQHYNPTPSAPPISTSQNSSMMASMTSSLPPAPIVPVATVLGSMTESATSQNNTSFVYGHNNNSNSNSIHGSLVQDAAAVDLPIATPVYASSTTTVSTATTVTNHSVPGMNNINNGPPSSQIYSSQNYHKPNTSQISSTNSGGIRYQDGTKNGTYIGQRNSRGQREGYGTMAYDDGSSYEGSWSNNKKHGPGTMNYRSGPRLDGNWRKDSIHGSAKYYYPDGRVDLRLYRNDNCVGDGVQFSPDRTQAYLLNCGRRKKWINATEAGRIARRLGLSVSGI